MLTGETKMGASRSIRRSPVELEQVATVSPAGLRAVVEVIERNTYRFASESYSYLRYGNAITDIWTGYRTEVDLVLKDLGFAKHVDVIQAGLQSDNPEAWRATMLECRNLLHDLAGQVWRDPRDTYEHLPGNGQGGKLQVTSDRFANRLSAYLHQKGLRGTAGKFTRDEIERLAVSIRSLIAFQSEAHEPVTKEDTRSVALSTYFVLGEVVMKTDMKPVESYGEPSTSTHILDED